MALPREYTHQMCSLARALEVVGERWSLLIVRDAFYGVRRFSDFSTHLRIPRAVLAERLDLLVREDVLVRTRGSGRRLEYELTAKGLALWPVLRSLVDWGDAHYAPDGPRRVFTHAGCEGEIGPGGRCTRCAEEVPVAELVLNPGPGLAPLTTDSDDVTRELAQPRPMLTPVHT